MALSGTVEWGKQPRWESGDEMNDQQPTYLYNYLVSASLPMVYQIVWAGTTSAAVTITDQYVPVAGNDLINTIFIIEATTEYEGSGGTTTYGGWEEIGRIKKSRDLPVSNIVTGTIPQQQTFTIDISRVIQDQLSYSLCPAGKGSWETVQWGGMNGGEEKQDTVIANISPYIVKRNATYRNVRVTCEFEQLDALGNIVESSTVKGSSNIVTAVNSVVGTRLNAYYNQTRVIQKWGVADNTPKLAMTNCPNYSIDTTTYPSHMKPIASTDNAEFLQFYVKETYPGSDDTDWYNIYEIYGQTYTNAGASQTAFVLGSQWKNKAGTTHICSDISHDFNLYSATAFEHMQNTMTVQNVAPAYINAHAYTPLSGSNYPYVSQISPIISNTGWYRMYIRAQYYSQVHTEWKNERHSSVYWYKIDDVEKKGSYKPVRFHWVNRAGGIDSLTATGNITEGLTVSKSLIGTALPDRRYQQSDVDASATPLAIGSYYNDSMRGFNTYKGGSQIGSMNAASNKSAYTQPMPYLQAKWFEEIFTSPNVWVQVDTETAEGQDYKHDAPYVMTQRNSMLRPDLNSKRSIYLPVIITNTEVTSVSQEEGLTSYNIQYSESQEIQTQRN